MSLFFVSNVPISFTTPTLLSLFKHIFQNFSFWISGHLPACRNAESARVKGWDVAGSVSAELRFEIWQPLWPCDAPESLNLSCDGRGLSKGSSWGVFQQLKGLKVMKAVRRKENWETENIHVHVCIFNILYDPRPPVKAGSVSLNTHTSCVFLLRVSSTQIPGLMNDLCWVITHSCALVTLHIPEQ